MLQNDRDRLEGESTINADWEATFRAQNTVILVGFSHLYSLVPYFCNVSVLVERREILWKSL